MTDLVIATIPKTGREEIRVSLSEYNGHQLFNARIYFVGVDGEMRPGKGVAFKVEKLPEFAAAVNDALDAARAEGLL